MTARKKRSRHRGAAARANSDLDSHIASLGLKTIVEYQRWCRGQGFTGALNKSWQERRRERSAAERVRADADAERAIGEHVAALGLASVSEYRSWCSANQLSDSLHKSSRRRRHEVELCKKLQSENALATARRWTHRPADIIAALLDGAMDSDLDAAAIQTPYVAKIAAVAAGLPDDEQLRANLRRLLLHAEKQADLFDLAPAIPRFGADAGNTYIDGLAALSRHSREWMRPVETWKPDRHSARRQFGSLARHLLAQYELPAFMDTAWFRDGESGTSQQHWFKHVASGGNIRTAALPVELNKKMAHHFLLAPGGYTVEEAFRHGQVIGQGGDEQLVEALIQTRLGSSFEHEEFWSTVVHWLVKNPMLDPECIATLVDYIHDQKYTPQEVALPGGGAETMDPPQPHFSMKSRSALKLLQHADDWRSRLVAENRIPATEWERCDIGEFDCEEQDEASGTALHWSIRELTRAKELQTEGRAMQHCVRSYTSSCRKGTSRVFSVQLHAAGTSERMMTVAVNPRTRQITQARGKHNALPGGSFHQRQKKRELDNLYRTFLRRSRKIVRRWAEQEELHWGSKV